MPFGFPTNLLGRNCDWITKPVLKSIGVSLFCRGKPGVGELFPERQSDTPRISARSARRAPRFRKLVETGGGLYWHLLLLFAGKPSRKTNQPVNRQADGREQQCQLGSPHHGAEHKVRKVFSRFVTKYAFDDRADNGKA